MGLRIDGDILHLEGHCNVEDAEPLFAWLQTDPNRVVDLAEAMYLHTAVVQVLLALRPRIIGSSRDPFIEDWIFPSLQAEGSPSAMVEQG